MVPVRWLWNKPEKEETLNGTCASVSTRSDKLGPIVTLLPILLD